MGRGASRSKSGGMTVMKDSERKIIMKNSNITLFEFIQEGCFEKDFMAYCANRLNDYSCVHWLDPDISEVDPSLTVGYNDTDVMATRAPGYCFHEGDQQTLYLMKVTQVLMPLLAVAALVSSLLTLVTVTQAACRLCPLASYLAFLAILDLGDLVIRCGDVLLEVFTQTRVLAVIQILTRSSCQMLPFFYNVFRHGHACLYLAMAVDNWRFVKDPRRMNAIFRHDWIRNVVILIAAVLLTVNAQFFWTFDVVENDNRILHNRFVKSTFECSFSTTWPLSQAFTEYIWPVVDHLVGEILPMAVCFWLGLAFFRSPKVLEAHLERYVLDLNLLVQLNRAISVICLIFGVFSLPRVAYFTFKYSSVQFLRTAEKVTKETLHSRIDHTLSSGPTFRQQETLLQYSEFFINHINLVFVVVKFLVLAFCVGLVRKRMRALVSCGCKGAPRGDPGAQETRPSFPDQVTGPLETVPLFSYTV